MTGPPTDGPETIGDLDLNDHACWVPATAEEQREPLIRYLTGGLLRGEQVAFFGAPGERAEAVGRYLTEAGVPVTELTAHRQLILAPAETEYVVDGVFDPDRRLRDHAAAVRAAVDRGFRGLRVASDVAWLPRHPHARRCWPGYEFGAELLAARLPFSALCVYQRQDWAPADLALIESLHARRIGPLPVGSGFRLRAGADGTIRLSGEIDLTYAPQLTEVLATAAAQSAARLDLTDLAFADVAGVRAIAMTCQTLVRTHGRATVRGASPMFRRIWRLAAFDRLDPAIVME